MSEPGQANMNQEYVRLYALAERLGEVLAQRGWRLATAESCTGGGIAACVTEVAGSSAWFDRGFVTYSNAAKSELLGVAPGLIETHGAVSEAVVRAMTAGALQRSQAQVAVAVSGIAGPGGGAPDKPVGTVWFAWKIPKKPIISMVCHFSGDRVAIRQQTIVHALKELLHNLS